MCVSARMKRMGIANVPRMCLPRMCLLLSRSAFEAVSGQIHHDAQNIKFLATREFLLCYGALAQKCSHQSCHTLQCMFHRFSPADSMQAPTSWFAWDCNRTFLGQRGRLHTSATLSSNIFWPGVLLLPQLFPMRGLMQPPRRAKQSVAQP